MPFELESITRDDGVEEVWVRDLEREDVPPRLAYEFDPEHENIRFYPDGDFPVARISLRGFRSLPPFLSENGYFRSGLGYYLQSKLRQVGVTRFQIVGEGRDWLRNHSLGLTADSLNWFQSQLKAITNGARADRSQVAQEFFSSRFPSRFSQPGGVAQRRARRMIQSLDESVIEHLGTDDLEVLFNFVEILLKKKYSAPHYRQKLFRAAKIRIDDLAIDEVIGEFEALLEENPAERKWGRFLERNLFLLDSKYVWSIPELNVVLAGARNVDFGLVDSLGFLDIFEIKKPSTKLLASGQDRGNHYWNTEATKAIVQAEKYLFEAERKADPLTRDIRRQCDFEVAVVKPRAVLVIGSAAQLDTEEKAEDFQILRRSLKNVELVLYDELLHRIKNQREKAYWADTPDL